MTNPDGLGVDVVGGRPATGCDDLKQCLAVLANAANDCDTLKRQIQAAYESLAFGELP